MPTLRAHLRARPPRSSSGRETLLPDPVHRFAERVTIARTRLVRGPAGQAAILDLFIDPRPATVRHSGNLPIVFPDAFFWEDGPDQSWFK
jgi:hypothetical protein